MINKTGAKKLRIAMMCDLIDYTAGVSVSTIRFAERLIEKGHSVIFIGARSPWNPKDGYSHGIKTYRFFSVLMPKSEKSFYISFPRKKQLEEIFKKEKINIIHLLLPTPSAIAATMAAKSLGIKVIAHSHSQPENLFLHLPKFLPIKILNRLFYGYLAWLYGKANGLIYPSTLAQTLFPKLNGKIKNIVISNGIDITRFKKTETGDFLSRFKIPRGKKHILFVGRLHPEKCVHTLIRAIPHVLKKEPAAYVSIVGMGHLDHKLKKMAGDLGILDTNINFLGKISDEDLLSAYNSCDVFVLPSLAELEGMAVLEAMACGKPIIIADSKWSASTCFVDGNGFLFEPENEINLAEKITLVLANDELREKMAKASLRKSKEYDINESVEKLESMYYSIVNQL